LGLRGIGEEKFGSGIEVEKREGEGGEVEEWRKTGLHFKNRPPTDRRRVGAEGEGKEALHLNQK